MSETKKLIRPKIRKAAVKTGSTSLSATKDADDVEQTRQRMEAWIGVGGELKESSSIGASEIADKSDTSVEFSTTVQSPSHSVQKEAAVQVKPPSILKAPKYTSAPQTHEPKENPERIPASDPSPAICKDFVVERDPTIPNKRRERKAHNTIEGHTTNSDTPPATSKKASVQVSEEVSPAESVDTSGEPSEESPLVLNSMEEMFQAAGEAIPHDPNRITADTKMLEADLAFSVMTSDTYEGKLPEIQRDYEQERQDKLEMFMGTEDVFDDGTNRDDSDSEDDEEDDELLEMLMESAMEDEEDNNEPNQPRAFRLLWEALAGWITPEAVAWLASLKAASESPDGSSNGHFVHDTAPPQVDRSDIGASRCAGLMAMVKLYVPKCLEELGQPVEMRRLADTRLGGLLRTFDYSQEAPKLGVDLWKAMTCVLLEMVLVEAPQKPAEENKPPSSVGAVGIASEEYHYLTRSSIASFAGAL